jgi:hypothetical protein
MHPIGPGPRTRQNAGREQKNRKSQSNPHGSPGPAFKPETQLPEKPPLGLE